MIYAKYRALSSLSLFKNNVKRSVSQVPNRWHCHINNNLLVIFCNIHVNENIIQVIRGQVKTFHGDVLVSVSLVPNRWHCYINNNVFVIFCNIHVNKNIIQVIRGQLKTFHGDTSLEIFFFFLMHLLVIPCIDH